MKKWFSRLCAHLAKFFGGARKALKFLEAHVDDAIAIVKNINDLVLKNPVLTGVLDLLPTKYKNASKDVIAKFEQALIEAINDLTISSECLKKSTTEEKILCFIAALKQRTDRDKSGTLLKLAGGIAQKTSGLDKMKDNVIDTMTQTRFFADKNSRFFADKNSIKIKT